ncbi:MAG: helix-turn-helix domain-containing protein [Aureliella sp.]
MDSRHREQQNRHVWLNIVSVADYADASIPTVRRWLRRGLLPATKLACGTWRVKRDDLEAFMQGTSIADGEQGESDE